MSGIYDAFAPVVPARGPWGVVAQPSQPKAAAPAPPAAPTVPAAPAAPAAPAGPADEWAAYRAKPTPKPAVDEWAAFRVPAKTVAPAPSATQPWDKDPIAPSPPTKSAPASMPWDKDPILVKGPDGALISFPAGTSRDVMENALRQHYPAKAATGSMPWDKDPITAAPAADAWAAYRKPAPMSAAQDVAESAGSGLVKGAVGALAAPAMLPKMAADALVNGGDHLVRWALGMGPAPPLEPSRSSIPDVGDLAGKGMSALQSGLHQPQTEAGKYADTIASFVPSVVAGPGGILRKTAEAVVPGALSEVAGEKTAGTKLEPWARVAAGLVGGGGVAAVTAHASAPANAIVRATQGVSPAEFQLAQDLQSRAAGIGVPLSGPEAIQAVTGGATKLADLQRVVEGASAGGATTARFYAQRPDQVGAAAHNTFDAIAPTSANPSTIGPAAADAADRALNTVRQDINTSTQGHYLASAAHTVPSAALAAAGGPAFAASVERLRADPVLGPLHAQMPDNSIAVIDAATKDMRAQSEALGNAANPGFQPHKAALFASGADDVRALASDPLRGGSQEYADALASQEQQRRTALNPLEQGPLGKVAAAADTQSAHAALLPAKPLAGGAGEVADTARRLLASDPQIVSALLRQHLSDHMDDASRALQSGPNQFAGANFTKAVAGTPQQRENLAAAIGAVPRLAGAGGPGARLDELLSVLRATGMRKQPGSATEFNRQTASELSKQGPASAIAQAAMTGGISLPSLLGRITEGARQASLARNSGALADMFLAPDAVNQIRALTIRGKERPVMDLARRAALQTPAEIRAR